MRRLAAIAVLAIATVFAALTPARAQCITNFCPPPPPPASHGTGITPLGYYAIGSFACVAAAPIVQTAILGRELTMNEAYRSMLGCVAGPVGWAIADWLAPPTLGLPTPPKRTPAPRVPSQRGGGRNISIPPAGLTAYVPDEILLQLAPGVSQQAFARSAGLLQITLLETQTFDLTGRTLQRWRIVGGRSVTATLSAATRNRNIALAQPNYWHRLQQSAAAAPTDAAAQYVVSKLRLKEAHRISSGDDVVVAVIDSKIDSSHADLAGVVVDEYDVIGTPGPAHAHGTAMASAIAAQSKLLGVAPKVKLLAVRAFAGGGDSAQATTFNVMKGLDWAAGKGARIVNMSFAGPNDAMLRDMLGKANERGIVLIAAVGNAGPRSPPLYPAADAHVIGVTATDAEDKLLPQANRGTQVAVAAPGVDILAAAPEGGYQVTSGTSVAAAHASGVAALLLARDGKLTPAQVRNAMIRSAHPIAGPRRDFGAGVIDALAAVNSLR
jgi:subtilisin family serine protease